MAEDAETIYHSRNMIQGRSAWDDKVKDDGLFSNYRLLARGVSRRREETSASVLLLFAFSLLTASCSDFCALSRLSAIISPVR